MGLPNLTDYDFDVCAAAVARTIPGFRHASLSAVKKYPQSVGMGGEKIARRVQGNARQASFIRGLSHFVLPLSPDGGDRWGVLTKSAAAYGIVLVSLILVHIPFVLDSAPHNLKQAMKLLWRDLASSHLGHLLLYGALISVFSYTEGLYDTDSDCKAGDRVLAIVKVTFWATVVFGVGLGLCGSALNGLPLFSMALISVGGLLGMAMLSQRAATNSTHVGKRAKNVLIVGVSGLTRDVVRWLAEAPNGSRIVKGIIGRSENRNPLFLGTIQDLARIARANFVDEIIVVSGRDRELAERAVAEAVRNHLDVSIVPELFMDRPSRFSVHKLGPIPLISVHEEPIPSIGLFVKRIVDVVISSAALLCSLPLMFLTALAIKLESRGPILYAAPRAGRKGCSFKCYKFRTMYANADKNKDLLRRQNERQGPTFKIVNDPRITPLGRILRRYSLDELPQLWNVFTGNMSLVGPRPHPLDDYQRYTLEDRRRLDVAPGITGLWQVLARGDSSFATNMALDLQYIENWTLGLDLAILWRTLPAVLKGTGA